MHFTSERKIYKAVTHSNIQVVNMAITLETIHREIKQMREELHMLRSMLDEKSGVSAWCSKIQAILFYRATFQLIYIDLLHL